MIGNTWKSVKELAGPAIEGSIEFIKDAAYPAEPLEIIAVCAAVIIVLFGYQKYRKSPSRIGRVGEAKLKKELVRIFRGSPHKLLHNVTVPDYDGTAQIDFILITPSGVMTIECKNLSGWIFGSAKDKTWTQTFRSARYKFQNPLHQSFNHKKTVQALTGLHERQISSLIVFTGNAKFRTGIPNNTIQLRGLRDHFRGPTAITIAEDEIDAIAGKVQAARLTRGIFTNFKHRKHIKEVKARPKCPKCRSRMTLRTANRGTRAGKEFWGCTRYPKCSGTVNIDP